MGLADEGVGVAIGTAVEPCELATFACDHKAMMDFLRDRTYALSRHRVESRGYGV